MANTLVPSLFILLRPCEIVWSALLLAMRLISAHKAFVHHSYIHPTVLRACLILGVVLVLMITVMG